MMKQIIEKANAPKFTLMVVACLYLVFLIASLDNHHWNPSRFVLAGDKFVDAKHAPENLYIYNHSYGYDGQFYYRMALNPFSKMKTDFGIELDGVVHRKQRIFYPFLAWVLSGGHPKLLPTVMILINYLSLCCMGFIGGVYAKDKKRHALWGLVFPLYAGFLLTISRDLTEILEITMLLSAFVSMERGRNVLAAILLSLAVLTRESALLVVAAIFIDFIYTYIKKQKENHATYLIVLPLAVYVAWRGWLFFTINQNFEAIPDLWLIIGFPFKGFINFFINTIPFESSGNVVWFIELCLIIIFTLAVIISFRSNKARNYEKYSWILYCILIFMLTNNIWIEDWGFLRIISEFYLTGSILLLHSQKRFANYIFYGSIASWFPLGAHILLYR